MKKLLFSLPFLLFPSFAMAAGFATQSIFLSQSDVMVGDTVRVHATVSNDANASFSGEVSLLDGSQKLGEVSVTLAAGEAQAVSADWSPKTAGTHTITAELTQSDGSVASETSANFDVKAPPQPTTPNAPAQVESSQNIQDDIAQYAPQTASILAPAFNTLDSWRDDAAGALNHQLNSTKASLGAGEGGVLGTSTQSAAANPSGSALYVLKTIYFYILTILLFLIGKAAVFYPLIVLIFFYVLWRVFRRIRRPAY